MYYSALLKEKKGVKKENTQTSLRKGRWEERALDQ